MYITGKPAGTQTSGISEYELVVNSDGSLNIGNSRAVVATTATLANVSGSASSVTLLALNAARLGFVIVNDSSAVLYVKFGSTASTTSFTYLMQPAATLDSANMPYTYTGIITGIWASATGAARVTEVTA